MNDMGRAIVVANQKGGVGKTTTAINLAACLAEAGQKVLAIDMDPQGNMTSGLGVDKDAIENTVYELLLGEVTVEEAVQAALDAIEKKEASVNSFVTVDREKAMARAKEVQKKIADGTYTGPLAGVPVAMIVPAFKVIPRLSSQITSAMPWMNNSVLEF